MPLLLMCFRFPNIVHSQDLAALLEWPLLWGRNGILFKHLSKLRNISLHREIGNTQKSIDHIAHIQVTNPLGILTVSFITLLRFRVFWMGKVTQQIFSRILNTGIQNLPVDSIQTSFEKDNGGFFDYLGGLGTLLFVRFFIICIILYCFWALTKKEQ